MPQSVGAEVKYSILTVTYIVGVPGVGELDGGLRVAWGGGMS